MADTPAQIKPVGLSPTTHQGIKVKQIGPADHLKTNHFAKVYTSEYSKAGTDYPVIFLKDPQTGDFMSAVMWGVEPGENLFIENGRWMGGYFPASVRCYPFAISPAPDNPDQLYIGIFEDSTFISREEGELIFNEDGTETKWMNNVKEFLANIYQQEQMTKSFVKTLDDMGLLIPQGLTIKTADQKETREVGGFFVVDKEKLAQVPNDKFLELRKNNALELIYCHLMSLESLDNLVRKKNVRNEAGGGAKAVPAAEGAAETGAADQGAKDEEAPADGAAANEEG